MIHVHTRSIIYYFLSLAFLFCFVPSNHAAEKDHREGGSQRKKQITDYFNRSTAKPTLNPIGTKTPARVLPIKPEGPVRIDLTKDDRPAGIKSPLTSSGPVVKTREIHKAPPQLQGKDVKEQQSLKRPLTQTHATEGPSKKKRKIEAEMQVSYLNGSNAHIQAYSQLIDEAEGHIIIASWNLNFIPQDIFSSLLNAKRRGVSISFVVNAVKREQTLDYFYDDEDEEATFDLFETKSHAKFLFVDSKALILGSYNALGESYEESDDASFMIKGTVQQLWPFYMSIYETYTSIGEDLGGIFDGIAMISKARNPGQRPLLQRSFDDGSQIFLLRTLKEHEDFFRLATPHNGNVTIYSPFSTKDNTLKRLKALESLLSAGTKVHLKVLQQYERGLKRLLTQVPNLQRHAHVHVATSHQKIVILDDHTICAGSLNWLSAAQDAKDHYANVELSVVLQGPKAEKIIKSHYRY